MSKINEHPEDICPCCIICDKSTISSQAKYCRKCNQELGEEIGRLNKLARKQAIENLWRKKHE